MTKCSWKNGFFCITGIFGEEDATPESFSKSSVRRFSPLLWRVPILIWALAIMFWSMISFWGPIEMFFLYMTHWGLFFIVIETIFGIFVAVKEPYEGISEHPSPSNFYVSCWQSNRSSMPLLALRTFLFLYSTCVLLASMVMLPLTLNKSFGYWFIYMSHWGLILIVLTMGFSTAVSAYAYFNRPIDATFGLPWYVKTYWVLYNISIPVAFLITVFYWGILKTSAKTEVNYAPNPILDLMLHGVNSIVMFVELVFSAHPSRLMHVMQPLWFAGAYMMFTVIYFFAGGLDPWGNPFIYPVVDWSKPDQTMVVITLTALFLALMHLIVVAIATARDAIARRRLKDATGIYNDGFGA